MGSQEFGANTVCGSSRVPGLSFFWKLRYSFIPLDIACGFAFVSDLSSASSGRFGPVLGSLTSGPTQTIGPWTQHAGVAARLGSGLRIRITMSRCCKCNFKAQYLSKNDFLKRGNYSSKDSSPPNGCGALGECWVVCWTLVGGMKKQSLFICIVRFA